MGRAVLYRSRFLLPVHVPPIENGAVLVRQGRIAAEVGPFPSVRRAAPSGTHIVDLGESLLMPGLVNCHCHLALSWMKGRIDEGLGFSSWLRTLMRLNEAVARGMEATSYLKEHLEDALRLSRKAGTVVVADVTNDPSAASRAYHQDSPFVHLFYEIIHPLSQRFDPKETADRASGLSPSWSMSAHSVYTCSRQALRAIKGFCSRARMPFSIHVSESEEELVFVTASKGPMAEILEERKRDIGSFFVTSRSPVQILHDEGILDDRTICVHCTLIDDQDVEILASTGAWVCLCPDSNRYITGLMPKADVIFTRIGRVCFGTDSLASTTNLSILSQLRAVFEAFPGIDPALLIEAATLGGARALGLEHSFGSMERGAAARFVSVGNYQCGSKEIFEFLCSKEAEERIEQIEPGE